MGFASGPITFRRFFIGEPLPKSTNRIVECLRKQAFGQNDPSADGVQAGWVSPEHLFDSDITEPKVCYDRFVFVQMRIDRTSPSGAIVRSYVRMEELAALDASGNEYLNKKERQLARESALARAREEAAKGLFRRPAAIPVLIDTRSQTVYFGNLGDVAGDRFLLLFRDTFDVALEPATSGCIAHRIMSAAGDSRSVEDARPFHLTAAPVEQSDDESFNGPADPSFLGREFLTWLWFQTDAKAGSFALGGDPVTAMMTQSLRLDCDFKLTGSTSIRADGTASAPEARAGLAIGKQPTRAGLLLSCKTGDYFLVLDGPRFNLSSLRIPEPAEHDAQGRLEERFNHICDVAGIMDMLFGLFLGRRAASDWDAERSAMTIWAARARLDTSKGSKKPESRQSTNRLGDAAAQPAASADESGSILKFHGQASQTGR